MVTSVYLLRLQMLIPSFLHDHHSYIGNGFSENENILPILENNRVCIYKYNFNLCILWCSEFSKRILSWVYK